MVALCVVLGMTYLHLTKEVGESLVLSQGWDSERHEMIQLPASWFQHNTAQPNRTLHFSFSASELPGQEVWLYIPAFEQTLAIAVNGHRVENMQFFTPWRGPLRNQTALIHLPHSLLMPVENQLQLTVGGAQLPMRTLSPLYLGSREQFSAAYLTRSFLSNEFKWLTLGGHLFILMATLVLILIRPQESVFRWLSLAAAITLLFNINLLTPIFPTLLAFAHLLPLFSPLVGFAILGFSLALSAKRFPAGFQCALLVLITCSVVGVLGLQMDTPTVVIYFSAPLSFLLLLAAIYFLQGFLVKQPSLELTLLVIGLLLLCAGLVQAVLLRAGLIEAGFLLLIFVNPVVLVGIAIFMMRRQATIANELDDAGQHLKKQLAAKERELHALFTQHQQIAEQAAKEQERRLITAELHDGVAGHLSTIVALSQSNDGLSQEIKQSARNALDELRMILEAFASPGSDLRTVMAAYRERCRKPLERLGINLEWSISELPETCALSAQNNLDILRIIQEAVTNAVNHGDPKVIRVSCSCTDGRLSIVVTNSGGVSYSGQSTGYGIRNMQTRALQLNGGELQIKALQDGAEVVLRLDL